jgi:hypothetical protein
MKCKKFSAEQSRLAYANLLGWSKHRISLADFRAGLDIEREHGSITQCDPIMTGKIALDHLKEDPLYYQKLARVEGGRCG